MLHWGGLEGKGGDFLRIGICDDAAAARESLRLLCLGYFREEEPLFFEFSGGPGLLGWLERHRRELDLLFLDIEMPGLTGMDTARKLRTMDRELPLVFVTGYADYVYQGYEVGAMGYLVKPVDRKALYALLARVEEERRRQAPDYYVIRNSEGLYRIPKGEILYACSDRRLVSVVTADRTYAFYAKLDDVAKQLGPAFLRIHQRYLVQTDRVEAMEGSTLRVGGASLPVSRSLRQSVSMALARHMLGEEAQP